MLFSHTQTRTHAHARTHTDPLLAVIRAFRLVLTTGFKNKIFGFSQAINQCRNLHTFADFFASLRFLIASFHIISVAHPTNFLFAIFVQRLASLTTTRDSPPELDTKGEGLDATITLSSCKYAAL